MNRVIISKNLQWYKYLMLFVVAVFLGVFFNSPNDPENEMAKYIGLSIVLVVALYFAYDAHQSKQVSYDEQLMYLTLREKEESIPLNNIESIKLTLDHVGKGKMLWKISYLDKDNKTKSLKILPIWENGIFEGFHAAVKSHNPKVVIKHTANSWSSN